MIKMTFNGETKPWLYLLEGRQKSPFAPVTNNLLRVSGRLGAYIQSTTTDVLYISQPIGFIVTDDQDALDKINQLAAWLLTDEPVELQFSDEPGRTYYAKVDGGIPDFSRFADQRKGTITFVCADPYAYGPQQEVTFPSDFVNIENLGTAEAEPIFEVEVEEDTTFIMLQNTDNEYMMIGEPLDDQTEPFVRDELVVSNPLSSTTGWTPGTQVDAGTVSGSMVSDGSGFIAQSFGSQGSAKWYGPALKTSLSEQLQNFKIDVLVDLFNASNRVGRVDVSLLDINNNVIASLRVIDAWENMKRNRLAGYLRNDSRQQQLIFLSDTNSDAYGELWNDFDGILRLERRGQDWMLYAGKIRADGTHHARRIQRYKDNNNEFQQPVAQVQFHIGIFDGHNSATMKIKDLKVWKVNNPNAYQIPYVAYAGDKITFDHKNEDVLLNGEPRNDLKTFGSSYFNLKKGSNQIVQQPDNILTTKCTYRPRHL
ncbi:distal tail protein Dit [Amphibacillus jilinensis]|uniref:distal tail protein Dit n=1 Tax=Amphibacillus jilinensis TaxID=1216008 RepID=UPI0002D67E99|nr:distal tail protein Dit [Amphibacillus jilinensis]